MANRTNWAHEDTNSFVVPCHSSSCSESMATTFQIHSGYDSSWSIPFGGIKVDGSAASAASKSHSQAEKRRRDRINAQLASLRKLIPKSDKMDKAALLGSVVEQVKDLKRKAMEVTKFITVPTEVDEVTIDSYLDQDGEDFVRVSLCCDDRLELLAELTQALKGLKLTITRADMACLGGRIKGIFVLCNRDGEEGVGLNTIKQSLKGVLGRIALSSSGLSYGMKSKRQRFFMSNSCLSVPFSDWREA